MQHPVYPLSHVLPVASPGCVWVSGISSWEAAFPWQVITIVLAIIVISALLPRLTSYLARLERCRLARLPEPYQENVLDETETSAVSSGCCSAPEAEELKSKLAALTGDYQVTASQILSSVDQMKLVTETASQAITAFDYVQRAADVIGALGEKLTQQVEETTSSTQRAREALVQTLALTERVCLDTDNTYREMSSLEEAVRKVDGILTSIGEISHQTRLLALNASIEAARAGQHGRGFAVVADEVKKLSLQTEKAVGETGRILTDVKNKVKQMEQSVQTGQRGVNLAVQAIDEIRTELHGLEQQVEIMSQSVWTAHREIQEYFGRLEAAGQQIKRSFASIQAVAEMLTNVAQIVQANAGSFTLVKPKSLSMEGSGFNGDEQVHKVLESLLVLAREPRLKELKPELHGPVLRRWMAERPEVEAVYSNRRDGTFIFSEPPAALANARIRPWWQKAIAGENYVSPEYISAITRLPCRTVSVPLRDNTGEIVGTLAADMVVSRTT